MTQFRYNTSIEIIKANDNNSNGDMLMKGVASTPSKDQQGDTLNPTGFDLTYFLKNGLINWNHEWKKNPMSIIGKPTKAFVNDKNELEVEYYLFKGHQMAKEVFALAKAMAENGLQLGLSIEGKVLEKDAENPKIIKKAMITDIAVTPHPINMGTTTEIAKSLGTESLIDFEAMGEFSVGPEGELIVKGMSTEEADPLVKESLETDTKSEVYKSCDGKMFKSMDEMKKAGYMYKGKDGLFYKSEKDFKKSKEKWFSKSEFINFLENRYEGISKAQAETIFDYTLVYKEQLQMKENQVEQSEKKVSDAEFAAALTALNVVKGTETEVVETVTTEETGDQVEKGTDTELIAVEDMNQEQREAYRAELVKGLSDLDEIEGKATPATTEETVEKGATTEVVESSTTTEEVVEKGATTQELGFSEELIKGISSVIANSIKASNEESDKKFEAMGTLIKGMSEKIETLEGQPNPRRSVQTNSYVPKTDISKGSDTEELGQDVYSVSQNRSGLATKLTDELIKGEQAGQNLDHIKGDVMALEATGHVTAKLQEFAKSQNITIIA